jgi:hypothetical protein
LFNRRIKGGFIGLGRLIEPAHLSNKLQRGGSDLVIGYRRLKIKQEPYVAAHF